MAAIVAGVSNQPAQPSKAIPPYQWHIGDYYFDCWLQCSQSSTTTITSQPVSIGANRADHAFSEPREFSFQISVLNTVANNLFAGSGTRAVNAYNLLEALRAKLQFVELGTKYGTYQNVMIKNITVDDDFQTQNHMTALVTLQEVITANSQYYKVSANPQATDTTSRGNVSTAPPFGTEAYRYYILKKTQTDLSQAAQ